MRARSPLCQHDAPIRTSARSRYVGRPPATWPAGEPPDTLPFRGRPKFPEGVRLHPSTTKQSRTKLTTKGESRSVRVEKVGFWWSAIESNLLGSLHACPARQDERRSARNTQCPTHKVPRVYAMMWAFKRFVHGVSRGPCAVEFWVVGCRIPCLGSRTRMPFVAFPPKMSDREWNTAGGTAWCVRWGLWERADILR